VLVKLLEDAGRRAAPGAVIEVAVGRRDGMLELSLASAASDDAGRSDAGQGDADSLGLWIAARLAEAMGGGLSAEDGVVRAWFGALPRQRHPGNVV